MSWSCPCRHFRSPGLQFNFKTPFLRWVIYGSVLIIARKQSGLPFDQISHVISVCYFERIWAVWFESSFRPRWRGADVQFVKSNNNLTNWRQFSCVSSVIDGEFRHNCGSGDYFDNVMAKFIVNKTNAWKTNVNMFFTITNRPLSLVDTSHKL